MQLQALLRNENASVRLAYILHKIPRRQLKRICLRSETNFILSDALIYENG